MLRIFFEKLKSVEKKKSVRFNRIITIYIIKDFPINNINLKNNYLYE